MNLQLAITFFCFLLLCRMYSYADSDIKDIWAHPQPVLENIVRLIPGGNYQSQEKGALRSQLQNLAYAINQEIIAAESPSWAEPTPERQAIIRKWQSVLAPYTGKLVPLALDPMTYRTGAGGQSRSLLDFAPPTEDFARQVRPYLEGPKDVPLDAGRLLYEHRLLREEDKAILSEKYKTITEFEERGLWAASLSGMGMSDGLEYAREALGAAPVSNQPGEVTMQYQYALGVMGGLGPAAHSLLPELDRLMAGIDKSHPNALIQFEYIRDLILGKKTAPIIAINGSGWLDPKHFPKGGGTRTSENPSSEQQKGIAPAQQLPVSNSPHFFNKPFSLSWMVIAGGVIVLAFLGNAIRKRMMR